MKTLFVLVGAALASGSSTSADRILQPLEPIDHRSLACGCTFHASTEDSVRDFYAGPVILVLDPNGEPPHARVNLGGGNIALRPAMPIEFPLYQCVAGELWISEWLSDIVTVRAEFNSLRAGEESCAFTGNVIALRDALEEVTHVNGSCGC